MIHDLGEDPASSGIDDRHEALGADWLAARFGKDVSEPVRLHVAAKRYLCATEADYFDALSPVSVRSLAVQGGPMSPDKVEDFRSRQGWEAAVQLRRWDDQAKRTDPAVKTVEDYVELLTSLAR